MAEDDVSRWQAERCKRDQAQRQDESLREAKKKGDDSYREHLLSGTVARPTSEPRPVSALVLERKQALMQEISEYAGPGFLEKKSFIDLA